jgi:protein-S-isoprenylcysteine O-methyltransferase Ste14
MKRRIKVHGFIIFCALLIIIAFPSVFLRSGSLGLSEEVLSIVGIACVLMGQIFRLSSRGFKSEQSKSGGALVESGPYSLVRNPMYLGIILIGLGLVVMLFRWWAICVFLAAFSFIYIRLIFQEEKKLINLFGATFEAYRKKVPAIIPSFSMALKSEISNYLPLRPSWLKREIGSICGVLVFALAVKSWENISTAGYVFIVERLAVLILMIILTAALAAYLISKTNACKKSL